MIQAAIGLGVLALAALSSLLCGGRVEKRGLLLSSLCLPMIGLAPRLGLPGQGLAVLAGLVLTLGLGALAWKSPAPWPAPASGFALVLVFVQILAWMRGVDNVWPQTVAAVGVLVCLAGGSLRPTKPS